MTNVLQFPTQKQELSSSEKLQQWIEKVEDYFMNNPYCAPISEFHNELNTALGEIAGLSMDNPTNTMFYASSLVRQSLPERIIKVTCQTELKSIQLMAEWLMIIGEMEKPTWNEDPTPIFPIMYELEEFGREGN